MKRLSIAPFLVVAALMPLFSAWSEPDAAADAAADPGWPREFKTDNHTVVVFQPQVDEWTDHRTLKMRAAVAVSETGKEDQAEYGALFAEVTTDVDSEKRQVLLTDRKVTKLTFPDVDDAERTRLAGIMKLAMPDKQELVISLDRIIAALQFTEQQAKQVKASEEVPPIFVSEEPALLVMFIGDPVFQPVADSGLLFATNTNWDVFMTTGGTPSYFLRSDEQWFTTADPKAPRWQPVDKLPEAFGKLPTDENWEDTRKAIPGKPASDPVKVFYSDRPGELIVVEGAPALTPVTGTTLMAVKNTDADLFFHPSDNSYYFLSSGRWFVSKSLASGWALAPADLPPEFAQIPEDHEKADVLASVPGTPAAKEAVIMASIPERATIDRSDVTLEVAYDGEPKFTPVAGTTGVEFALNSNFDVFLVSDRYFCCQQGVWFVAPAATGAWAVCDKVPEPIYTIPAEHPKHNVTYVYVYDSNEKSVETGYTSGYTGSYIVNGLVMFGLGYWIAKERYDDDYWAWWCRYQCRPSWYGYGCRAYWSNGRYWRGASRWYGPYGGAGRQAIYNPRTGGWARSGYAYGPRGSVYSRAAYNPYTNTFGRVTRVNTPYGSWSKGVVNRNGNWAMGGKYTGLRGSVGGASGSRGGAAIGYDKRFGGQGGIAKGPGGDVYVGRDGSIHKLDPGSGTWQRREGKTWAAEGPSQLKRVSAGTREASRIDTSRLPDSGLGAKIQPRPAVQPTRPAVRPTPPAVQPSRPAVQPTRPAVQPTRPAVQPSRPAVQPSRPTARPTVQARPTLSLDRQAFARQRGSQTTVRRASSSRAAPTRRSTPSRGGGGIRRR